MEILVGTLELAYRGSFIWAKFVMRSIHEVGVLVEVSGEPPVPGVLVGNTKGTTGMIGVVVVGVLVGAGVTGVGVIGVGVMTGVGVTGCCTGC